MNEDVEFLPPPGSPPLLTLDQVSYLSYHGWLPIDVPAEFQSRLHDLSAAAAGFFDLGSADKRALYPQSQGTERGFYHVPQEKEYLTFRHQVHGDSELEQHVREVWLQAGRLLYRILCDLSKVGYLDPRAWDSLVENALQVPLNKSGASDNITLLRVFRYYPTTGFAAEHVDVGLLTLCVGGGQGLQLWDRSQSPAQWVDAQGPIILAGDTTRALFNGKVRAGLHRVVGNPEGRSSTVFALRPCLKGAIDLAQFGGEGVISTRDYYSKIKGSKCNINATKGIRDEQRKAQEVRYQQIRRSDTIQLPRDQG